MNVEILDPPVEYLLVDDMDVDSVFQSSAGMDARRMLENKIDEQRLLRDLKEFDFD